MHLVKTGFAVLIFQVICNLLVVAVAREPIKPLPQTIQYNKKVANLGKMLFMDTLLSKDNSISCHSCHDFSHGGAEPYEYSTGVFKQKGNINAPTVFNSYFNFRQFWNGRAADLTEQAAGPLHNPIEMGMTSKEIEQKLNDHESYPKLFHQTFGTYKITIDQVTKAIAEFEKALITPNSKFDRYLRGEVELTQQESDGYLLFKTLGCASCHNGINIGGNSFQYLGAVNEVDKELSGDLYEITKDPFDRHRYKVPSLRNIMLTPPYLHTGEAKKIEDVVKTMAFHNLGYQLDNEEITLLVAFFETLTGDRPAIIDSQ